MPRIRWTAVALVGLATISLASFGVRAEREAPQNNAADADASEGGTASPATAASFEPDEDWNIIVTTIDPNNPQDLPVVWAANVPFSPEESTGGFPMDTVKSLPPRGIVMTVIGPRDYTGETVLPPAAFPLTISQGFCRHDQYETQPAPQVAGCLVDTMVGEDLLNVTVWFGTNRPSTEMYRVANEQLARLVLPAEPR
jgi:hypothetical protein